MAITRNDDEQVHKQHYTLWDFQMTVIDIVN